MGAAHPWAPSDTMRAMTFDELVQLPEPLALQRHFDDRNYRLFRILMVVGAILALAGIGSSLDLKHPVTLVAEERTLKGSYIGTAVPGRDIPRYIELYRHGRLPVDRLLSGTLKHDELNQGFDRLHAGEVFRQVVLL